MDQTAADPAVVAWLETAAEDALYLSVLAFAEIRLGIELLPYGQKRRRISAWLDDELPARFEGRIIDIDRATAEAWARIVARGRVGASRRRSSMGSWRQRRSCIS